MADAPRRTDDRTDGRAATAPPPARVLEDPEAVADGIRHGRGAARALLPWSAVRAAIAAEVGEPEGVRTVVFDLVVEQAGGSRVLRLDAEPGADAMQLARAIAGGIGGDRKLPSIDSLAADGTPAHWFPDLGSFDDARVEILAKR